MAELGMKFKWKRYVLLLCWCCVLYIWKYFYKIIQQSYFVPFNVVYRCVRDCKWNCEKSKLKTIQFLCQTNKWISPFLFLLLLFPLLLLFFIHSNYICLRSPVISPVSLFPLLMFGILNSFTICTITITICCHLNSVYRNNYANVKWII